MQYGTAEQRAATATRRSCPPCWAAAHAMNTELHWDETLLEKRIVVADTDGKATPLVHGLEPCGDNRKREEE